MSGIKLSADDDFKFVSIGLEPLLRRCTALDPTERPSMSEVTTELFQLYTAYRAKENWVGPKQLLWKKMDIGGDFSYFAIGGDFRC